MQTLFLLLAVSSASGCGDDAASDDAAMDARPDTTLAADSAVDAVDAGLDSNTDARIDAASDAGDADAATASSGTVTLIVSSAPSTIVGATFAELPVDRLTSNLFGCVELRRAGDCQFLSCDASLPTFAEAGTLSVDVAGARLADLDPMSGVYARFTGAAEAMPGDAITFVATGAEVPAFTATVTVADVPVITLPTNVRRAEGLVLSWTIGAMGAETLRIGLAETAAPARSIVCEVAADAGSLTIEASMLTELPAMVDATIAVTAYNEETVTAGGFDIVATSGSAVTGTLTLQ